MMRIASVATAADRSAIEALIATCTTSVSTKNQALFETLLLDKDIPLFGVGATDRSGGSKVVTINHDAFRKGVFEGAPFAQRTGHPPDRRST